MHLLRCAGKTGQAELTLTSAADISWMVPIWGPAPTLEVRLQADLHRLPKNSGTCT